MLKEGETEIIGKWIVEDKSVVADENCKRIEFLINSYLIKVSDGDWVSTYKNPADGALWELSYPDSHMHGGGAPTLKLKN